MVTLYMILPSASCEIFHTKKLNNRQPSCRHGPSKPRFSNFSIKKNHLGSRLNADSQAAAPKTLNQYIWAEAFLINTSSL